MLLPKFALVALGLVLTAGAADACIQVYPYSEICRDPVGFVTGLLP